MKLTRIITAIAVVCMVAACGSRNAKTSVEETSSVDSVTDNLPTYVEVLDKDSLTVYIPNFSRIDLVTETMPSKDDSDVIFVCEAAFTGELLDEFKHSNIAGHHVSGGEFYKGYNCTPNNGIFTWNKEDSWTFYNYSHNNSEAPLMETASKGGMGFGQCLLFFEGKRFKGCFKPETMNRYRTLCELDGKLCIIDCSRPLAFGSFMDGLQALGVKTAIYCDMGTGWNYSWYRNGDESIQEIFTIPGQYTTNWITFYK